MLISSNFRCIISILLRFKCLLHLVLPLLTQPVLPARIPHDPAPLLLKPLFRLWRRRNLLFIQFRRTVIWVGGGWEIAQEFVEAVVAVFATLVPEMVLESVGFLTILVTIVLLFWLVLIISFELYYWLLRTIRSTSIIWYDFWRSKLSKSLRSDIIWWNINFFAQTCITLLAHSPCFIIGLE